MYCEIAYVFEPVWITSCVLGIACILRDRIMLGIALLGKRV